MVLNRLDVAGTEIGLPLDRDAREYAIDRFKARRCRPTIGIPHSMCCNERRRPYSLNVLLSGSIHAGWYGQFDM